jgi:hypothetical protein
MPCRPYTSMPSISAIAAQPCVKCSTLAGHRPRTVPGLRSAGAGSWERRQPPWRRALSGFPAWLAPVGSCLPPPGMGLPDSLSGPGEQWIEARPNHREGVVEGRRAFTSERRASAAYSASHSARPGTSNRCGSPTPRRSASEVSARPDASASSVAPATIATRSTRSLYRIDGSCCGPYRWNVSPPPCRQGDPAAGTPDSHAVRHPAS